MAIHDNILFLNWNGSSSAMEADIILVVTVKSNMEYTFVCRVVVH